MLTVETPPRWFHMNLTGSINMAPPLAPPNAVT